MSNPRPPDFITFTGADDWTDIEDMRDLSRRYPIEWGILFSVARAGIHPRYPGDAMRFARGGLRLAAHLCGGALAGCVVDGSLIAMPEMAHFGRIQINHAAPVPDRIDTFCRGYGARGIAQCRGDLPADQSVDWLYDQSGGRGQTPTSWPPHPGDRLVGYAGGISSSNVAAVITSIASPGPYWIDMESGVRDAADRFDLARCAEVCAAVWPETPPPHPARSWKAGRVRG